MDKITGIAQKNNDQVYWNIAYGLTLCPDYYKLYNENKNVPVR